MLFYIILTYIFFKSNMHAQLSKSHHADPAVRLPSIDYPAQM